MKHAVTIARTALSFLVFGITGCGNQEQATVDKQDPTARESLSHEEATVDKQSPVIEETHTEEEAVAAIEQLNGRVSMEESVAVKVEFAATPPTDDHALRYVKALTHLKHLSLDRSNNVTDDGVKHLSGLTELETLDLAHSQVTDAGMEQLAGLTKLMILDVSHTAGVGNAGLGHVEHMKDLRQLYLRDTKVTDDGLERLKHLPRLDVLAINNTAATDASIDHLSAIASLTYVDARGTKMTEEGVNKLKRALPRCTVKLD